MKARRGVYAAAISPISEAGELDIAKLVDYCRYLLSDGGCDGVAPLGTTGEGTSLSLEDRLVVPGAFAEADVPRDQVIFGTGAAAVGDAIRLTKACLAAGYGNVLVLPPFYYKSPSEDGLFSYYARIVEEVADPRLRRPCAT